jgi:hypothetical protein
MEGSRELLGLPGPEQQPLVLVRLGPVRDHALEHVGEPGKGSTPFIGAIVSKTAYFDTWHAALIGIGSKEACPRYPSFTRAAARTGTAEGGERRLMS